MNDARPSPPRPQRVRFAIAMVILIASLVSSAVIARHLYVLFIKEQHAATSVAGAAATVLAVQLGIIGSVILAWARLGGRSLRVLASGFVLPCIGVAFAIASYRALDRVSWWASVVGIAALVILDLVAPNADASRRPRRVDLETRILRQVAVVQDAKLSTVADDFNRHFEELRRGQDELREVVERVAEPMCTRGSRRHGEGPPFRRVQDLLRRLT